MDEVDGSLMVLSTDSEKEPLIINDSESVHHHPSILLAPAKFNNCGHQLPLISVIFILVASVPALLVGCTVGFPSAALLDLQELETRPQYKFDTVLSDVFAAMAPLGAIFGGPIAGWISDALGRKMTLLLVILPYLTGYMMITYAHYSCTVIGFRAVLLFGRFFTGIGMGWSCLATPVYVAEVSPTKYRGFFGSFFQLFLVIGLVFVYTLGSLRSLRYYDVSLVIVGILTVYELMALFVCDTPRWLMANKRVHSARRALRRLRGKSADISVEWKAMENDLSQNSVAGLSRALKEFRKKEVIVPILIATTVMFFNQSSGLNARNAYAAEIFQEANLKNPRAISAYAIGGTALVFTIVSLFIVDQLGRKILLVVSGFGMLIGTVMLGSYFYVTRCNDTNHNVSTTSNMSDLLDTKSVCDSGLATLSIASIILFSASYAIGWGPVVFVLVGEMIPLQVRGIGSGIATLVNWTTASLVVGFYLYYAEKVGAHFAWWTFSCFNLAAVIFVLVFVPETKGKSLEEIQQLYKN